MKRALPWLLVLLAACDTSREAMPTPEVPPLQNPERHVPPADPVVQKTANARRPERPVKPRVAQRTATAPDVQPDAVVPLVPAVVGKPGPAPVDPVIPSAPAIAEAEPEVEGTRWLEAANEVRPGCLLERTLPLISVPSPAALTWILTRQPHGFAGVAREALCCVLRLPALTGSDVYGATAWTSGALSGEVALSGGDKKQGVVATPVVLSGDGGHGTAVWALDPRADGWVIRSAVFIPTQSVARLSSIDSNPLLKRDRRALVLRQTTQSGTTEHWIALTTSDELREVFAATVKAGSDTGSWTGKIHRRGGYPKRLVFRSLTTDDPKAWTLSEWTTVMEDPYTQKTTLNGFVDLAGIRSLLDAGYASDAAWVLGRMDKASRKRWAALLVKAQIQVARKRHKQAARSYKTAASAQGRPPEVLRDYGRYLASRRATRRKAAAQFKRYLEAAPDAVDYHTVLSELEALKTKKKRK